MIAISPTGEHVVYVADSQLYVRALDQVEAIPLAATAGGRASTPFFAPDCQWVGYWEATTNQLKKVAL